MPIRTPQIEQARRDLAALRKGYERASRKLLSLASRRIGDVAVTKYMRVGGPAKKGTGNPQAGPGSLRRITGRLQRSLQAGVRQQGAGQNQVDEGIASIREIRPGVVRLTKGSRVPYARIHEEGWRGPMKVGAAQVSSYTRKDGVKVSAHTRKAHTRNLRIPKRPYLQPALDDSRDYVVEQGERLFAELLTEALD